MCRVCIETWFKIWSSRKENLAIPLGDNENNVYIVECHGNQKIIYLLHVHRLFSLKIAPAKKCLILLWEAVFQQQLKNLQFLSFISSYGGKIIVKTLLEKTSEALSDTHKEIYSAKYIKISISTTKQ